MHGALTDVMRAHEGEDAKTTFDEVDELVDTEQAKRMKARRKLCSLWAEHGRSGGTNVQSTAREHVSEASERAGPHEARCFAVGRYVKTMITELGDEAKVPVLWRMSALINACVGRWRQFRNDGRVPCEKQWTRRGDAEDVHEVRSSQKCASIVARRVISRRSADGEAGATGGANVRQDYGTWENATAKR